LSLATAGSSGEYEVASPVDTINPRLCSKDIHLETSPHPLPVAAATDTRLKVSSASMWATIAFMLMENESGSTT